MDVLSKFDFSSEQEEFPPSPVSELLSQQLDFPVLEIPCQQPQQNFEDLLMRRLRRSQELPRNHADFQQSFLTVLQKYQKFAQNTLKDQQLANRIENAHENFKSGRKQGEFQVEIYRKNLEELARNLRNLTNKNISFHSDFYQVDLPQLCQKIVKIIGGVISRELLIQEKQKNLKPELQKELKILCTSQDLDDVYNKIAQVKQEIIEYGCPTQVNLQVGLASINVYIDDQQQKQHLRYNLPLSIAKNYSLKQPAQDQRQASLQKGKPPVCQAISQRNAQPCLRQVLDPMLYIHSLQEQIIALHTQMACIRDKADMRDCIQSNIEKQSQTRTEELQTDVDYLTFKLQQAKSEIKKLKQGNFREQDTFLEYSQKLNSLKEREALIRSEFTRLDIQRQKLTRQTLQQTEKIDQQTQISIQTQENQTQTFQQTVNSKQTPSQTEFLGVNTSSQTTEKLVSENSSQTHPASRNRSMMSDQLSYFQTDLQTNQKLAQTLQQTGRTIAYAQRKLRVLQQSIPEQSVLQQISLNISREDSDQEALTSSTNRRSQQILIQNKQLCRTIRRLQQHIQEISNYDQVRDYAKFKQEVRQFLKERDSFAVKRELLNAKIAQINRRQAKLREKQSEIDQKRVKIQLHNKKTECYQLALDEEWSKMDEQRRDVIKCNEIIEQQWRSLLEQSKRMKKLYKIRPEDRVRVNKQMERNLKPYKSSPVFQKGYAQYGVGKTARILKMQLQHHEEVDKSLLRQLQSQLEDASRVIQNLSEEKHKLKLALSDTLQKKEQLFNQAKFFYNQLQQSKAENLRFRKQLLSTDQTKHLLDQLREGLQKRDQIISQLRKTEPTKANINSQLISKVWELAAKTHENLQIRDIYSRHFSGGSLLRSILQRSDLQSLSSKLVEFVYDVIEYSGKTSKQDSFCEKGTSLNYSLPMQIDRITRLNQEMASTMERSREILSSPSSPTANELSLVEEKSVKRTPVVKITEQSSANSERQIQIQSPSNRSRIPRTRGKTSVQRGRGNMGPSSERVMPGLRNEEQWGSIQQMFNSYIEDDDCRARSKERGDK